LPEKILVRGQWRESQHSGEFQAENPTTKEKLSEIFPISSWNDCEAILDVAELAAEELACLPAETRAQFLEAYATGIENRRDELATCAHEETALPVEPRFTKGELPRTINQLRQAAKAARERSWTQPVIDSQNQIRSMLGPMGPVCVFGPNNFPFAYNGVSGGDFASAIAAGNPVIAIAHYCHPATTKLLAEEANKAATATGLPAGSVQMIYRLSYEDGKRLVSDPRVAATGFTGSRAAGIELKKAAEAAGNLIYLEMSSVNPVIILPGALKERGDSVLEEYKTSVLMGVGQFCTNPGLILMIESEESEKFTEATASFFKETPAGTLLSSVVENSLKQSISTLREAGAELLAGDEVADSSRYCYANTLLRVSAKKFLASPEVFQTEAFGNASLLLMAKDVQELGSVLRQLEGNLTACIYSDTQGADDSDYDFLAPLLRSRVGRLLNDQMPTGVAVSSAMNHGGPYPATGHAGFSAVGFPASVARFGMLQCFDQVREARLPPALKDKNPTGSLWRLIDGNWSQDDVKNNGG
jgi:alpha-ketoglutaric semialdehyde dehydrogenase